MSAATPEYEQFTDKKNGKPCRLTRIPHEDDLGQKSEILRMTFEDQSSVDALPGELGKRFVPVKTEPK